MRHLVFCWEFGEAYGHIAGFIDIAKQLKQAGVKVSWIVRHLDYVHLITEMDEQSLIFQAPVAKNSNTKKEPTLNYSQLISFLGYANQQGLLNRIIAWRTLLSHLQADLIVADHAPTALLAARTLGIKRTLLGTGFFSPPRSAISPAYTVFAKPDDSKLQALDKQVIETINHSLQHFECQPIQAVADIFAVAEDFLCTFPELDHYPERVEANYWGSRFSVSMGQPQQFETNKYKVFVYLKGDTRHLGAVLTTLNQMDAEVLVHIPHSDSQGLHASYPQLRFYPQPVQMASILPDADLIVCNAGHGTLSAALLAGVPLVLLPLQLEQMILARRLAEQGLCKQITLSCSEQDCQQVLKTAPTDRVMAHNVKQFANAYHGYTPDMQGSEIVQRLLELL